MKSAVVAVIWMLAMFAAQSAAGRMLEADYGFIFFSWGAVTVAVAAGIAIIGRRR